MAIKRWRRVPDDRIAICVSQNKIDRVRTASTSVGVSLIDVAAIYLDAGMGLNSIEFTRLLS